MNNNIPAQTEQTTQAQNLDDLTTQEALDFCDITTQAPSLDDLTKAFAEVSFQWSMILTYAPDNTDTETSRFKWLAQSAETLEIISMKMHVYMLHVSEGSEPTDTKKPA